MNTKFDNIRRAERQFRLLRPHLKMSVLMDCGPFRHLLFSNRDSIEGWFNITTWPGSLCIDGDYGTFVFCRVHDMFSFFRHGKPNYLYWAEKAKSGLSNYYMTTTEWSPSLVESKLMSEYREYKRSLPKNRKKEFDEAFDCLYQSLKLNEFDERSVKEVCEFGFDSKRPFQYFYEFNFRECSFRYVFCANAIAFAVKQYDKWKANPKNLSTTQSAWSFGSPPYARGTRFAVSCVGQEVFAVKWSLGDNPVLVGDDGTVVPIDSVLGYIVLPKPKKES